MARIFVSYRRDDAAGWTGRLTSDLQRRFGPEAVFRDIDALDAGEDFVSTIGRVLESCAVVLVIVGPKWASIQDESGVRRLDHDDDLVRIEVAKALQRQGLRVIPVLVGGATMPGKQHLPDDLDPLAQRNAFEISDKRWDYDVGKLTDSIAKTIGSPDAPRRAAIPARSALLLGAAALAILGILWFAATRRGAPAPPAATLGRFSIDRPLNNDVIPLSGDHKWMVEGSLGAAAPSQGGSSAPKIDVEVFTLPDRRAIRQDGRVRISTETGFWRFESATFGGPGSYELVATVAQGGRSHFQSVAVQCVSKPDAFRQAINADREQRGARKVAAARSGTDLSPIKRRLYQLQEDFETAYVTRRDLEAAQEIVASTLDLLDPVLPSAPDDKELQGFRAYAFKNYGMVRRDRGDTGEFTRALDEAERMFAAIRQQDPADASAWNGLGSVAALRNEPAKALQYIDRALELQPDYPAALQDRREIEKMLKSPPGRSSPQ